MPMFLVTFMELIFSSPARLTIQIGARAVSAAQNTGLCAKRSFCPLFGLHGSGVQSAGRTDPEVSTSYLADNLNLSACFRRRRPESERDRSYRPLACVPEINAAMRTPQKPGPRLKRSCLATRVRP